MNLLRQRIGPRARARRGRLRQGVGVACVLIASFTLTGCAAFPKPAPQVTTRATPAMSAAGYEPDLSTTESGKSGGSTEPESVPSGDPGTHGPASMDVLPASPDGADPSRPASPPDQPPAPRADAAAMDGGFGGMGGFGRRGGGTGDPGYGLAWYPSRPVSGQGTDLGLVRQNLSAALPVWRDGGDALLMSVGVSDAHFSTDAILPDTHRPFPTDLWNVNLGLNYLHRFENGWSGGVMANFGSASDQPFHSLRDMDYGLGAFLRIPAHGDRDAWTVGAMYSPVGTLNIPIPMVSYAWNPSDYFHMSIGLPLALMWRPTDDLTVNLSYVPLTNVNGLVTYRLFDPLRVYGGYQFLNEAYYLADRADAQDRFFAFEQRLLVGARWNVWRQATLDLNTGYAFDRHYGEGTNQTSSLHDQVDVAPGAFLGMEFTWKF